MNDHPLYELHGVGREIRDAAEQLTILKHIDFQLHLGESAAIIGASGSGKSTLMHILGALDKPSWGRISFCGKDIQDLDRQETNRIRNQDIGFVFQFHHLLPEFTTLENVAMPGLIYGATHAWSRREATETLSMVGLENRLHHRATTLSGGERQRAAIARALLLKPKVILADEPTGNLDEESGNKVKELLLHVHRTLNTSLVVVTHNQDLATAMQRRYELRGGELFAL
ncbi:MAG TPA: ABC transporter ATP-binding protein [Desulfonatronum sp.]|nr:ABC transporter ATP-binding protein [Desulfonatronum sp.]